MTLSTLALMFLCTAHSSPELMGTQWVLSDGDSIEQSETVEDVSVAGNRFVLEVEPTTEEIYNSDGDLVETITTHDVNGDGNPEKVTRTYLNEDGEVVGTTTTYDYDDDGEPDKVVEESIDRNGFVRRTTTIINGNGTFEVLIVLIDPDGKTVEVVRLNDNTGDGRADEKTSNYYHDNGDTTVTETVYSDTGVVNLRSVHESQFERTTQVSDYTVGSRPHTTSTVESKTSGRIVIKEGSVDIFGDKRPQKTTTIDSNGRTKVTEYWEEDGQWYMAISTTHADGSTTTKLYQTRPDGYPCDPVWWLTYCDSFVTLNGTVVEYDWSNGTSTRTTYVDGAVACVEAGTLVNSAILAFDSECNVEYHSGADWVYFDGVGSDCP